MSKVFAFLADGLEEVECLAVVDVLRRAGAEVTLVSVTGSREITGSHHIHFQADALFDETAAEEADVLFLPGGMPGTNTLKAHEGLKNAICKANKQGRRIAAICAAPSILGEMGLLKGRTATCYPGFEDKLDASTLFSFPGSSCKALPVSGCTAVSSAASGFSNSLSSIIR